MIVTYWEQQTMKISATVAKRIADCEAKRECLSCGKIVASDVKYIRGCCEYCRAIQRDGIKAKKFTEAKLICDGLVKASDKGGRPVTNPTRLAMQEAESS